MKPADEKKLELARQIAALFHELTLLYPDVCPFCEHTECSCDCPICEVQRERVAKADIEQCRCYSCMRLARERELQDARSRRRRS